jgi:hypothetical protein
MHDLFDKLAAQPQFWSRLPRLPGRESQSDFTVLHESRLTPTYLSIPEVSTTHLLAVGVVSRSVGVRATALPFNDPQTP